MPEAEVLRLEQDRFTTHLSRSQRTLLDVAKRVSSANPLVTPEDLVPLYDAGYEPAYVREALTFVAVVVLGNRITTIPAVPLDFVERTADRPIVKLLRPLIARRLRRRFIAGRPTRLTAEQRDGPFSYLLRSLDGLPVAARLRDTLDDAWMSPGISLRLRLLIFAVIARGLGCDLAEDEARHLLENIGFGSAALDEVLEHLASPKLDPIEALVVPFARDTIWYQPVRVQRRAREIRERVDAEQFIDIVGTVGLANAICRIGALAD
jgi:hypothetical protein